MIKLKRVFLLDAIIAKRYYTVVIVSFKCKETKMPPTRVSEIIK